MDNFILTTIGLEQFQEIIRKIVRKEIVNTSPHPSPAEEKLISIKEVAKIFNVSKVTLHKWKKKGLIPFYRVSSRIYFKKSELIEALQSNKRILTNKTQ